MAFKCFVCKKPNSKAAGRSVFRFPKEKIRCQKWLEACGLEINERNCLSSLRICSDHFQAHHFQITRPGGPKYLKADAVPKISKKPKGVVQIPIPISLQKVELVEPAICVPAEEIFGNIETIQPSTSHTVPKLELKSLESEQSKEASINKTEKKRKISTLRSSLQMTEKDFTTSKDVSNNLKIIKREVTKKNEVIRCLHAKVYRLRRKIRYLEDRLEHLQCTANILQNKTDLQNSGQLEVKRLKRDVSPPKFCSLQQSTSNSIETEQNKLRQTQETVDKHLEDSDTNKKDEFQPDEIQFKSEPIDIHEEPLLNIKTEPSDLDNSNLFAPVKAEPSDTEVQNENVLEPLTTVLLPTIKTEVFFDENEDSDPFK